MKSVLISSVTIVHPGSGLNNTVQDILISNGKILQISPHIDKAGDMTHIDGRGKYISPGFFDLNVNFCEPGFETKEDLDSGTTAAIAGGFTGLAVQPSTNPVVHSKSEVSYIKNKASNNIVDVHPLGSISRNIEGKDLAELYDMHQAGAVAFSDGTKAIADSGLMSRALLYAKGFEGLIISFPEDTSIAGKGKMNEGVVSTYLGMKGIPSLAEEVHISRDLYLAEYNDCPLHFSTISSKNSVDLIRKAKEKGLKVTCDATAHHLVLTDDELQGFDSNYKVKPPLRTHEDLEALIEGLKDGTIDAIVSQHNPQEVEFKDVEFEIAAYGIIGLQTVLPLLLKAGLSPELIVEKLSLNPRRILKLAVPDLVAGQTANLILFDTESEWVLDSKTNKSKSSNSPFFNESLKGKVLMAFNNNQVFNNL